MGCGTLFRYIWLNMYWRSSLTPGMLAFTWSMIKSVESAWRPGALFLAVFRIVSQMLPGRWYCWIGGGVGGWPG